MTDFRAATRRAALANGLDPNVFLRQINQESGFNPHARSPAGAIGIAQIMPGTAQSWGVDPTNPIAALNAAAKAMKGYVNQYGSYKNALVAYNAGPGRVGKALPAETTKYIDIILNGHEPAAGPSPAPSSPITAAASAEQALAPQTQAPQITLPARPVRQISGPSAPSFAAGPTVAGGGRVTPGASARAPRVDVNAALNVLAAQQPQAQPAASSDTGSPAPKPGKMPSGTAKFEGHTVAAWIKPALVYARRQGWKGEVNSGFRSLEEQTRIYNSGVRPAAKPGTSNHEGADYPRGAVDVTDPQALSKILAASPYAKQLQWAGAKDPVHFSHPHGGSY